MMLKNTPWHEIKKLAYIRRNLLGDLCAAMPGLRLLKQYNPDLWITLYVSHSNKILAPYFSHYFNDLKILEEPYGRNWTMVKNFLSPKKYDAVVFARPGNNWQTTWMVKSFKAKFNFYFKANLSTFPKPGMHQSAKTLYLISGGEITETPANLYPEINIAPEPNFLLKMAQYKLDPKVPKVLVGLSNNRECCLLNPQNLMDLLKKFSNQVPCQYVLTALPQDQKLALEFAGTLGNACYIPTPNFDQFMQLLNFVEMGFCGDSGTAHLLAALKKPQLTLMQSEIKYQEWRPLNTKGIALFPDLNANDVKAIPENRIFEALLETYQHVK